MTDDLERFLKLVRAEPEAERAAREILLRFRATRFAAGKAREIPPRRRTGPVRKRRELVERI